MPNCFRLYDKITGESPTLAEVDRLICIHIGHEVHPTRWCVHWYMSIGFYIAMGKPLGSEELRLRVANSYQAEESDTEAQEAFYRGKNGQLLSILNFLESRYTSDGWVER